MTKAGSECRTVQRCATGATAARRRQAGFVITLEVLLVMVVFVLPMLLGMVVLGRKLVTLYLNQREFHEQPYSRAVVWDSSPTPKSIGSVVGYDQVEAPLVIFRDTATNGGVALGVRSTRFTSFGEVYYADSSCTLQPRLRSWSDSLGTGTIPGGGGRGRGGGAGDFLNYPPVGFMYQMQRHSYAVGNGNILYRSNATPGTSFTVTAGTGLFVWRSQDYQPPSGVPAEPCFAVPPDTTVEGLTNATVVIDFDGAGNYVAPFRVAFPSPGASPAVPPPGLGG